jgi:hypothetical protein
MSKVTIKGGPDLSKMAHSQELSDVIESAARPIYDAAREDPNSEYVRTLRFYRHDSKGRKGRVSWRIGAHPIIGPRVEAIRGTLARAVSRGGF